MSFAVCLQSMSMKNNIIWLQFHKFFPPYLLICSFQQWDCEKCEYGVFQITHAIIPYTCDLTRSFGICDYPHSILSLLLWVKSQFSNFSIKILVFWQDSTKIKIRRISASLNNYLQLLATYSSTNSTCVILLHFHRFLKFTYSFHNCLQLTHLLEIICTCFANFDYLFPVYF